MKALEETYLRWVLRVAGRTPGYLVREELQWDKLGERAEKRKWAFEERLKEERGSNISRRCLKEVKRRGKRRRVK